MISILSIKAPAKINLGLTVLRRRMDGYHDLSTVMQRVSLADTLLLEPRVERGYSFFCSDPSLSGGDNLICRAADLLIARAGAGLPGVRISLYKQIPVAAGLGGGSSDAAAALRGLDRFWNLGLGAAELAEAGALLGSDIPYCLQGGTALARGRGERITPLPALPFHWVVLALPVGAALSTGGVYGRLSPTLFTRPPLEPLLQALRERSAALLRQWFSGELTNTLEAAVLPGCPALKTLRALFLDLGLHPAMTGSGPTFFALTGDLHTARWAVRALHEAGYRAFLCWTVP